MKWTISMLVLCFYITSCNLLQNDQAENHDAICKELKNRMIYSGATNNPIKASQDRAEMNNLSRTYREENCN